MFDVDGFDVVQEIVAPDVVIGLTVTFEMVGYVGAGGEVGVGVGLGVGSGVSVLVVVACGELVESVEVAVVEVVVDVSVLGVEFSGLAGATGVARVVNVSSEVIAALPAESTTTTR